MDDVFVAHFHGRIGYSEVLNMPVWKRAWYIKRIKEELIALYGDPNTPNKKK